MIGNQTTPPSNTIAINTSENVDDIFKLFNDLMKPFIEGQIDYFTALEQITKIPEGEFKDKISNTIDEIIKYRNTNAVKHFETAVTSIMEAKEILLKLKENTSTKGTLVEFKEQLNLTVQNLIRLLFKNILMTYTSNAYSEILLRQTYASLSPVLNQSKYQEVIKFNPTDILNQVVKTKKELSGILTSIDSIEKLVSANQTLDALKFSKVTKDQIIFDKLVYLLNSQKMSALNNHQQEMLINYMVSYLHLDASNCNISPDVIRFTYSNTIQNNLDLLLSTQPQQSNTNLNIILTSLKDTILTNSFFNFYLQTLNNAKTNYSIIDSVKNTYTNFLDLTKNKNITDRMFNNVVRIGDLENENIVFMLSVATGIINNVSITNIDYLFDYSKKSEFINCTTIKMHLENMIIARCTNREFVQKIIDGQYTANKLIQQGCDANLAYTLFANIEYLKQILGPDTLSPQQEITINQEIELEQPHQNAQDHSEEKQPDPQKEQDEVTSYCSMQ